MRLVLLTVMLLALPACDDSRGREYYTRMAVKGLATAPADKAEMQLEKVVARGSYTLVDIEQAFHGADRQGRLRLLAALERLADPRALPFVRYVARWDEDPDVRERAARVTAALGPPEASDSPPG